MNSDPYAASRYRPEDPLYAPLLAIQYGDKEKAETLLAPLVEQGDSEAMFWLAEITYGQSIYSGETAGKLLTKAAELGNPYAAIKLDTRDIECIQYMGYHCSEEWGEKGRAALKKLASAGDPRAGYAIYLHDTMLKGGYSPTTTVDEESFNILAKAAVDGAKNNYYHPIITLLDIYQRNFGYPIWMRSNESKRDRYLLSDKDREIIKDLYIFMANNNDSYATNIYLYYENSLLEQDYIDHQILRMLPIWSNASDYSPVFARKAQNDREALILGAAWALVDDFNRNDHNLKYGRQMRKFNHTVTYEFNQKSLDDSELEKAHKISLKLRKNLTPMIYLDENNTGIF
ncbi:hypothetical protein BCT27_24880 [Enterovibrio norvegicus]|nr:hypothetical protein BCT27_24880 [Enterovibrio norvegicus]